MWSSARRAADAVLSAVWRVGFAAAGRGAPPVTRWTSAGGRRIMVIAPHPDDEVAGAGGTILQHRRAGDEVMVVHVTDGRGSRALGLAPDQMAVRRRVEAQEGLRILGVPRGEWLGLREWEWQDATLPPVLAVLLGSFSPHVVYAPSRVDFHPEHDRVARALAAALASRPEAPAVVRVYQVQVPLTRALVNVVTPIGEVWNETRRAAGAYGTQEGSLRSSLRLKRYAARFHGVPMAAEEFWEMTVGAYLVLHAEAAPAPLQQMFRGLRRFSLTDPLAFVAGRGERWRLRGRVDALRTDR